VPRGQNALITSCTFGPASPRLESLAASSEVIGSEVPPKPPAQTLGQDRESGTGSRPWFRRPRHASHQERCTTLQDRWSDRGAYGSGSMPTTRGHLTRAVCRAVVGV